jgi:hypothetical protein
MRDFARFDEKAQIINIDRCRIDKPQKICEQNYMDSYLFMKSSGKRNLLLAK